MRNGRNLSTIADSDWAIVAVRVVIDWLLVVLEALHEREEVVGRPALHLEVVCRRIRSRSRENAAMEGDLPQSEADARVYIWKLMLEPPPRMFAHGTMLRLPRRCDDFIVSV